MNVCMLMHADIFIFARLRICVSMFVSMYIVNIRLGMWVLVNMRTQISVYRYVNTYLSIHVYVFKYIYSC